ncbi:MAG: ABC transporter permease [Lachnospiraceae bacterium]|nr:ABC transporter permease [Lachnospiraceae bacterium]
MMGMLIAVYTFGLLISEEAMMSGFQNAHQPPSWKYPFGTDALGRNLLLRTIKGLSVSITVGIVASLISALIAALVGMATAVGSKRVDAVVGWWIDLVMGVPHTVFILLISFALGRGVKGLLVGIAATHWCSLARLIRGEVLQLRCQQYVAVSRRLGKSGGWILIHHLFPHLIPQFFVGLVLMFPHVILHEASISFLGYGLPPEQPSIGIILSESIRYLSAGMWWMAVLPGLVLVGIVWGLERLADYLHRILDPYSVQE